MAARARSAATARDAGLEAAELATQLLRLQQVTALRTEALDWLDRLANLVRSGVTAGVRSPSDSIRVSLERDAALAALTSAQLEATATSFALLGILGIERDELLAIRAPADESANGPAAADSARVLSTLDRLPELELAGLAEAQSRIDLADAGHQNSAVIDWTLDAGITGADLTHAVPEDLRASDPNSTLSDRLRRDVGGSAAVHFHLPLWDGAQAPTARSRASVLEAARTRRAAELTAQRRRALLQLVEWRTAAQLSAEEEETARRAERSLLKVKSLYGGGATSLLDLLDVWRTYQDARERVVDAQQQRRIARFRVEDRR
jgi:outer membrane protein TolC